MKITPCTRKLQKDTVTKQRETRVTPQIYGLNTMSRNNNEKSSMASEDMNDRKKERLAMRTSTSLRMDFDAHPGIQAESSNE